jgi:multidrug efflux pump subunit AcrA (membrane-fusion protein)
MMSNIEEEIQEAQEEREEERHKHCQLLEQVEAEKAEETSKLQLAIIARDAALAESQRAGREICELQQQLESTNAALQDQVPWNDVQLILDQAHGDMVSTTSRFWNTVDALQNRRLASYLPGSGVIQADWPEQGVLATQGHDFPLSFSESNVPLLDQQKPSATNQQQSLEG